MDNKKENSISRSEHLRDSHLTINGAFAEARIFTDSLDANSQGMIKALCDSEVAKNSTIKIMPDVHAGNGCVVGTTMLSYGSIAPALLGGDIGCGITAFKLKIKAKPDLNKLDKVIRSSIPSGMKIHNEPTNYTDDADDAIDALRCARHIQFDKARRSIGTLGGGNHFIEVGCENGKDYWLIVHSGSRHLGMEVAELYHKKAYEQHGDVPYGFAYLTDDFLTDYLHDVALLQSYARYNRETILRNIISEMKWKLSSDDDSVIECPHNFIESLGEDRFILRKGAIKAAKGDRIIIPMNMRDGCLVCIGKGNADWNFSAPHGAGRLMARSDARNSFTLTQYKKEMHGIFTTCISRDTIDESPMAYKPMESIIDKIEPTAEIVSILKPIYNFKAGGE